jgi:hypothetical protein
VIVRGEDEVAAGAASAGEEEEKERRHGCGASVSHVALLGLRDTC